MKNKIIYFVICIILLIIFSFAGSRGHKETLKQYIDATMEGNGKKIVNLMPKEYVKSAILEGYYESKQDMICSYDEHANQYRVSFEERFGTKWKYEYEIIDSYDYSKSELDGFLTVSNYSSLLTKVNAIKEVTYKIKIYGIENESTTTENMLLVKMNRKWYIADIYSR